MRRFLGTSSSGLAPSIIVTDVFCQVRVLEIPGPLSWPGKDSTPAESKVATPGRNLPARCADFR
jgi:hypothetical protein